MRPIRASEISSFLYCKRAWWYQKEGVISTNVEELSEGTELHHQHGRAVLTSGLIRVLAYGLLLAAIVLFSIYVTNQVL
jgi:hypothetical protein